MSPEEIKVLAKAWVNAFVDLKQAFYDAADDSKMLTDDAEFRFGENRTARIHEGEVKIKSILGSRFFLSTDYEHVRFDITPATLIGMRKDWIGSVLNIPNNFIELEARREIDQVQKDVQALDSDCKSTLVAAETEYQTTLTEYTQQFMSNVTGIGLTIKDELSESAQRRIEAASRSLVEIAERLEDWAKEQKVQAAREVWPEFAHTGDLERQLTAILSPSKA